MHLRSVHPGLVVALACAAHGACRGGEDVAAAPHGGAAPLLLTADGAHVARVRDSLRAGEPEFAPALEELEERADEALTLAPMSVVDKPVTPPSGDKHDYMSQAPYYWPDPSKPDGLPYVPRDGRRNPEVDRIPDRENLARLARAAFTLGLAYHFTGAEPYAEQAARLVRVWFLDAPTRMNPDLEFAQGIPGVVEGRSAGIVESRFLPTILDGVTLLRGSPAWSDADDQALAAWMRAFLEWLATSDRAREQAARGNNQETWWELQLVALALHTGQEDRARTTLEAARDEIPRQFLPDGRQPHELARTRSWDYSIFNLTPYLHLARLGERVGVDLWSFRTPEGRSLQQGVDYLVPFATGERDWPHEQITEFEPSALHPVLRWAALGWDEPRYRALAEEIRGGTPLLDLTVP